MGKSVNVLLRASIGALGEFSNSVNVISQQLRLLLCKFAFILLHYEIKSFAACLLNSPSS